MMPALPLLLAALHLGYQVMHAYPHDPEAFTEGLFYARGVLWEATGLNGRSTVRKVRLVTGAVLTERRLPDEYFGEGIALWRDTILQLTYTSETGFIYDVSSLHVRRTFHYPGQGWSLTTDGQQIYMDDGTEEIRVWDGNTLREVRRFAVRDGGVPVKLLNELEWVDGQIYANVWHRDEIACVDPKTGAVTAWIDLHGLLPEADRRAGAAGEEQVLNGIAYDARRKRLFVTGKYWPHLYEIRVMTAALNDQRPTVAR